MRPLTPNCKDKIKCFIYFSKGICTFMLLLLLFDKKFSKNLGHYIFSNINNSRCELYFTLKETITFIRNFSENEAIMCKDEFQQK